MYVKIDVMFATPHWGILNSGFIGMLTIPKRRVKIKTEFFLQMTVDDAACKYL